MSQTSETRPRAVPAAQHGIVFPSTNRNAVSLVQNKATPRDPPANCHTVSCLPHLRRPPPRTQAARDGVAVPGGRAEGQGGAGHGRGLRHRLRDRHPARAPRRAGRPHGPPPRGPRQGRRRAPVPGPQGTRLLPTLPTTTTVLVFLRSRSARVSLKDCCFMLGTRQLGENLLFCWQVLLVKMGIR